MPAEWDDAEAGKKSNCRYNPRFQLHPRIYVLKLPAASPSTFAVAFAARSDIVRTSTIVAVVLVSPATISLDTQAQSPVRLV